MKKLILVVMGVAMLAASAHADEVKPPLAVKKTAVSHRFVKICKAEAKKLCGDVEPGDGPIAQCLTKHQGDIGKSCMAALRRAKRVATFRARCGADVKKLCPDMKPGAGRIHQCLKTNEATVSTACKTQLAKGTSKKVVTDAAAVADEAVTEELQSLEPLPEALPIVEEVPVVDPSTVSDMPDPANP